MSAEPYDSATYMLLRSIFLDMFFRQTLVFGVITSSYSNAEVVTSKYRPARLHHVFKNSSRGAFVNKIQTMPIYGYAPGWEGRCSSHFR